MSLNSPELGPVTVVGNTSGGTQYAYKPWTEGKAIRKLTVWEQSNRMRGIKLWKSGETDNMGQMYGSASGTASTFEFQPGELVTSLSLWQGKWNTLGDRAGRIEFTTSLGNSFKHGYQGGSGTTVNVYSGILVGVQVRAGDDINAWGFGFLRPLKYCQLQNVSYINISGLGGLAPETLDTLQAKNESLIDVGWSLTGTRKKTTSSSWSETKTETVTYGMSMTVSAEIPEISVGGGGSYEWQLTQSGTHASSFTSERTLQWSQSNTMKPGDWVDIKAMTWGGTISVPYTGTLVVTVDTGNTFSFASSGRYDGVSVTKVHIYGSSSQDPIEKLIA